MEKDTTEKTTASPKNLAENLTSKLKCEKDHLSKFCLEPKKTAHRVLIEESESEEQFVKRDQEEC